MTSVDVSTSSNKPKTVWKNKLFQKDTVLPDISNYPTIPEYEDDNRADFDTEPSPIMEGMEVDANYKNIDLPSIPKQTRKSSADWKPPISTNYADIPDGLNRKPKVEKGMVYLPSKDSEFIESTQAKIADILSPPAPEPPPLPTRPPDEPPEEPEDYETVEEGFQEGFSEKEMRFIQIWSDFVKTPSVNTGKKAFLITVHSISELFYIPNIIAEYIVLSGHLKGGGVVDRNSNFTHDVNVIKGHIFMIAMIFVTMYSAFNWWFLIFYTNHYIDLSDLLRMRLFNPLIWIIGPMLTPVSILNYYLLGKRTEKEFFDNYIQPVLDNKSLYFTLYLALFTAVYRPISKYYTKSVKEIMTGKPNMFYKMVLGIGVFTYFFNVVFDEGNVLFLHQLLSNFVLVIIFFLILFIFVMIACKITVVFIIMFFSFYSFFPLLAFNSFNPFQVISVIIRMISDTTETCVPENPTGNVFITIQNFLYKYATILYFACLVFGMMGVLIADTQTIIHPEVKKTTNIVYISILILSFAFAVYKASSLFSQKEVLVNLNKVSPISISETTSGYKNTIIARIITTVLLIIEMIVYVPFVLIDNIFEYTIVMALKRLKLVSDTFTLSLAGFVDHGIYGYGMLGTIFRFLKVNLGTDPSPASAT